MEHRQIELRRRTMLGWVVAGVAGSVVPQLLGAIPAEAGAPRSLEAISVGSITLVRDGVATASVVIPVGADDQVRAAAKTLIEYVKASSGAVLPLAYHGQATGTSIYVGVIGGAQQIGQVLEGLDDDGYVIAPENNKLTIVGPSPWGTRFGVYEFLERYLGVRWLIPGVGGDTVEQRSTITISGASVVDEPTFTSRLISPLGTGTSWNSTVVQPLWATRNRMHGRLAFGHNLHALFSPTIFANSDDPANYHPEFYPVRNGETYIPTAAVKTNWQPRFNAPGIAEAAAQRIIETFRGDENLTSYSLGVNDGGGFSEDDIDTTSFSSVGIYNLSEPYYRFVKAVAEIVGQEFPEHTLGLLAYNSVIDPPSFALPDNVVPMVTRDRYRWVDENAAAEDRAMLAKWRSVARNVGIYDYTYGQFYAAPRFYVRAQRDAYRWAADDLGSRYFYTELYPIWGESPKEWILAKLLWNPHQDTDVLTEDWLRRAGGTRASVHLRAYLRLWENIWRNKVPKTAWFEAGRGSIYFSFFDSSYLDAVTEDDIIESRRQLELAAAKTETPPQKARVIELLKSFEYYEASALSYPRPPAPLTDSQQAWNLLEKQVSTLDTTIALAEKRHTVVSGWASDPLRSQYKSIARSIWTGWNCYAMWDLGQFIANNSATSDLLRQRLAYLAVSGTTPNVRRYATNVLAIGAGNLLSSGENTSFETGATDPWLIEYGDPLREPLRIVDSPGIPDGKALVYPGGQRAGGISQEVPVTPGFFRHTMDVFATNGSWTGGFVIPTWILRNAERQVISLIQGRQVPLARAKKKWISLVHSDLLPANVATVQCYCSVVFLSGEMTLYVTNAQFTQIASE